MDLQFCSLLFCIISNRHLFDNKVEIDGKWGAAADLVFNFQHLSHSAL